jgi:hypothetical protein
MQERKVRQKAQGEACGVIDGMTRDPRMDPQPGDEVRGVDGQVNRVIQREGKMLLCESENVRYQMSVRSWQVRSRQTGCKAEASANVHPKKTAPKNKGMSPLLGLES